MPTSQQSRQERAATELQTTCPELSPNQIVDGLSAGLTRLRNLLITRVRDDVESRYGADSMITTSLAGIEERDRRAEIEIEAFSCVVVADEVEQGAYLNCREGWFVDWIFRLRFGEKCKSIMDRRVSYYQSRTVEERRLKFVSVLQRVTPQSVKAPLVLFRLFPRSLRITSAVAFGDSLRAQELRAEQISLLPTISDCHECLGRVLDSDEVCTCCGNPMWKFDWLLAN